MNEEKIDRMYAVVSCACHYWVTWATASGGRCARCKESVRWEGIARPETVTVCLHEGPCNSQKVTC